MLQKLIAPRTKWGLNLALAMLLVVGIGIAYAPSTQSNGISGEVQRSDKVILGLRLGPQELVARTSDYILTVLRDHRDKFHQDPKRLFDMIDEVLLPHFDFQGMSRWVLGKHWQKASDTQREKFTMQFRELLVRTYGTALLEYSNQSINYLPLKIGAGDDRVTVKTEIVQSGALPIPIYYRLYKNDEGIWKVYDVQIDGISLVGNYRNSFSNNIRIAGIDGLIGKLTQQNQQTVKAK